MDLNCFMRFDTVSYTHLDVYKRQSVERLTHVKRKAQKNGMMRILPNICSQHAGNITVSHTHLCDESKGSEISSTSNTHKNPCVMNSDERFDHEAL